MALRQSLLGKLAGEVLRYQNKSFLKAAMAVCALSVLADGEIQFAERISVDRALKEEPALKHFNAVKAVEILGEFTDALYDDEEDAKVIPHNKIRRFAGDHKQSRTLMRVSYLIISADQEITDDEYEVFVELCGVLDLEPDQVWEELSG